MTVTPDTCTPHSAQAMGAHSAAALAVTLKALADPLRLRILSAIATDPRGESCVCDLAELADVSQPTVSHHLKVLRDVDVLTSERRGTWVYYSINPAIRPAVTSLLDSFAPLAVDAVPVASVGLTNAEDALDRLIDALRGEFPTVDGPLVATIVRESYASLARSAKAPAQLLGQSAQFARQRLADITRDRDNGVPQVLFVCVANAGRSQLAAAILTDLAGGRMIARSAGSAPATEVHTHVRPLLDEIAQADDERFPKPLTDDAVRAADVVITMGCGDVCPVIAGVRYEDWAVGDPALASAEGAASIRDDIARRVRVLLDSFTL